MRIRKLASYALFVGFIGAAFFAVSHSQDIIDWWKLRDYQPSAVVEALSINASMSDEGRKLFYVHDPILLDKKTFADKCTVGEETIVLGCYVSRQQIYLFDVKDERLTGVEEVTAAHEMLHAAFDRLSSDEREEVGQLLEAEYAKLDNSRIQKTLSSYKDRDTEAFISELHSIFGTEIKDLPKALEDHYARYFNDRQQTVRLADKYAEAFEVRESKIEAFDAQLSQLQGEITRLEADLSLQSQALSQERQLIEKLSDDPSAYNQAVGVYNGKVAAYNGDVATLKSLINQHNAVVVERNKIALEERELVEAIDTRVEQL